MYNQNFRDRARDSFNNRGNYGYNMVIKDIEIIIIITEEMVIEVEITTGTEVGH